ncbi:MAG: nuclear transport factor 2 family protein [Ignavibacteria bacterium]|jgi:uncharacterized protein (TIGR02246 family)
MKKIVAFLMGVFFLVNSSYAQKVDMEIEKQNVKAVLDQFIKASETENMELLSKVYAHDPDMVVFGTEAGERIVGWDSLKAVMEKQFAATENSKFSIRDQVIKVHVSGTAAWFSELIDCEIVSEGETTNMEGLRATGVLEKRNGNWVIVQIHYSIPVES